jgi:hypothetical protein
MKRFHKSFFLILALAALALTVSGCATTDAESQNVSSRPWNSPRGWEYGVPGMMPQYGR